MKITNFEQYLQSVFEDKIDDKLYEAMNYSLLAGGKRFRPSLMFTSARMLGVDPELLIDVAVAIEMIHTYSLIHDDMPCLDDDDLRRGKLTNHKVYGEDYALLAGDNLQSVAFEQIYKAIEKGFDPKILKYFARACSKMVEGQSLDINESYKTDVSALEHIHDLKTGALIEFCVIAPLFYLKEYENLEELLTVGKCIGISFQIKDDILDVSMSSEELGKSNSDEANNKITYISLLGLDESKRLLDEKLDIAEKILNSTGYEVSKMLEIIDYSRKRIK